MRLVQQGDGRYLEVYDVDQCAGCGRQFNPYRASKGHLPCQCQGAGETGHRILHCPHCRHENYDPPHVPQYGPTLDVGGVSTHRAG